MTMGERIKKFRIENGMTQEELGAKIGVQKSAIRKYESGAVENIPRASIKKMADIFNVKPSYLMGWDDDENTNNGINNGIIGNQNNNNTITVGAEPSGEIETELISLCRKMNMQQKNKLLTCAYDILGE